MRRVALLSVHTSPLALPGQGEAGGMNVYIRELSTQLGQNGLAVDVFTRRTDPQQPIVTEIDDRVRLVALKAGPLEAVSKSRLFPFLPELVCNLVRFKEQHRLTYDALHTHYWLSGWVGSLLRQHWDIPLIATFHTLAELKRQARPEEHESDQRLTVERRLVAAADALVATSPHERSQLVDLYGANPSKVFVIPCGVDLDRFRPLDRRASKAELGLRGHRTLLVVGRLEPLKGIDLVIRALALLNRPRLRLVIVGDDSSHAPEAERLRQLAAELGVSRQVRFVGAVEQSRLPVYYAAADLCLVPSHYESFGLTALEALA
ncbi:MAG: glycosyltransferase, partial [Chloroflexi bacterium]|nr:glycosyltransferase [Chloroflexota bacterium]